MKFQIPQGIQGIQGEKGDDGKDLDHSSVAAMVAANDFGCGM
jgi:hypothetical protein